MGWVCINHQIGISIAREQGIYQAEHGYKHAYKLLQTQLHPIKQDSTGVVAIATSVRNMDPKGLLHDFGCLKNVARLHPTSFRRPELVHPTALNCPA